MPRYRVARQDDFDFLSPAYQALYDRSPATLFQHPVWLDRLYGTLAVARNAQPVVVTVRDAERDAQDELVGVLPLVRRRRRGIRRLEFADLGVCDYAAPVLDREHIDALLSDSTACRDIRTSLGRFDLLQVERLAGSGAAMATLVDATATRRHSYDTHPITLPSTPAGWPDEIADANLIRRLERSRKRLRPRGGATLRLVTDTAEVDALMERMQGFRRDRFSGRRAVDLVQDPDCFEFYRRAAHDGIVGGGPTQLAVLDVGGEPAAIALDLADADQHLYVLVGYDIARLRNCSLGLVIVDELIRSAVADGLRTFDLTVGNEGYKSDFGARPTPMYAVRVAATVRGRAAAAAADLDAVARGMAKRGLAAQARLVGRARATRSRKHGKAPPILAR
ncbi:MAG: GNAT family N-acetyltransferase [Actinomycetota bacterium]|nr:GNAT family N-acetyltransferase [Actinomycetota bacterium]